ncbi:MAG TPA: methylmalonyl-CoA epimerase [Actinomycetota bacterium]|nr:methylmalonyl-CoA epimerase [Actinomycetota bacterium]
MLSQIDHVAFAVSDLEAAIDHYERVWGLTLAHREVVAEQGVEEAMFALGESYLQLVAPLSPDSPVGRFLARRGEGLHHIAYRVGALEEALAALRSSGADLIDETPRRGSRNTRVAFVHPRTNHGVLVELVQLAADGASVDDEEG